MKTFFIYYTAKGKAEVIAENLEAAQEKADNGQFERSDKEEITETEVIQNTY